MSLFFSTKASFKAVPAFFELYIAHQGEMGKVISDDCDQYSDGKALEG